MKSITSIIAGAILTFILYDYLERVGRTHSMYISDLLAILLVITLFVRIVLEFLFPEDNE